MTRSEFKTISNLCALSEVLMNVDEDFDGSSKLEDFMQLDEEELPSKEVFQNFYKDRLKDGANIIDEYRDLLIFTLNLDTNPDTEQQFVDWFWEAAEDILVDPEHLDEEQ